jgi:hypothetical protein
MELVYSQAIFGRPFVVPPGVPQEPVAALRKAFMATLAEQGAAGGGAEDQARHRCARGRGGAGAGDAFALPQRIIERTKQALIYKPPS